jgi:nuclear pore complex protein Nup155
VPEEGRSSEEQTIMAAAGTSSDVFSEYWKDDYAPLQAAGSAVNAALRADEQDSNLYRRICNSSSSSNGSHSNVGSHAYFPADAAAPLQQEIRTSNAVAERLQLPPPLPPPPPPPERILQHRQSVPLPPLLAQQLATVRLHSGMGLLPAAALAWMSVDDKLYLWSYNTSNVTATAAASSFCSFTVPSGQCVITVGLVRPKQGTFVGS